MPADHRPGRAPPLLRSHARLPLRGIPPEHVLLLASGLIWGTLHPISKQLIQLGLTPTHITLCRMGLAFLTMLAVAAASGRLARLARLPRRDVATVAAIGLLGYFVTIELSLNGLTYLPAAMNSIFSNSSPLFVALLSPFLLRERPSRRAGLGLVLGFAGVVLLAQSRGGIGGSDGVPLVGVLLSLGGGALWGVYTLLARRSAVRLDAVLLTLIATGGSVPPLAAVALVEGRLDRLLGAPPSAFLSLLWLGVVGTGLSFLAWSAALRRLPAASVSAYGYLVPVASVFFAFLLLGEQPTPLFLLGAALVIGGVAVAQR